MRLVQFKTAHGIGCGVVDGSEVVSITSVAPHLLRTIDAFYESDRRDLGLEEFIQSVLSTGTPTRMSYEKMQGFGAERHGTELRPPLDHEDSHRVYVTGTGLTHLGSMKSRDDMHKAAMQSTEEDEASKSDSKKMFEMGIRQGKPQADQRGVSPEWFYKGTGANLRGPNERLEVPDFALDGGEEPELVGCYAIDKSGTPRRLGFALGNEWSDHLTERINYLYLAPSKLRECAVGPELVTDFDFQHLELTCSVERDGSTIYDSGTLLSGEENMSHSLQNCEDHHFKYAQHRIPGDIHLHYFGTSKLSIGERNWNYQDGDVIRITADSFSAPLVNIVRRSVERSDQPVRVKPA